MRLTFNAFALLALLGLFGNISCDNEKEWTLGEYSQRVQRFLNLVLEHPGDLSTTEVVDALAKTVEISLTCFKKVVPDFGGKLGQVGKDVAKYVKSTNLPYDGPESGSDFSSLSFLFPGASMLVGKIIHLFTKPDLQNDLLGIFDNSIKLPVESTIKCFADAFKDGMPTEEAEKLTELFKTAMNDTPTK